MTVSIGVFRQKMGGSATAQHFKYTTEAGKKSMLRIYKNCTCFL